jgi:cytochrome c-550 PedF
MSTGRKQVALVCFGIKMMVLFFCILTIQVFHMTHKKMASWLACILGLLACVGLMSLSQMTLAHGDVTPQAVDTHELPQLGAEWKAENPFRDNKMALQIGTSAYNQNCARCHGLEAISGGIAPDLRKLDNDCVSLQDKVKKAACVKEMDEYFSAKARRGVTRNGAVYMPPFEGMLTQEAIWSIKTYLESRRDKPL